jgi:predicted DCC family thiol-disulfide oxidoreductase YuxK
MIFDGECVLCSGAVRFVLRHERRPTVRFASVQSEAGQALAARHGLSIADLDQTFALVTDEGAMPRSDGVIRLAQELEAPWRWLALLRFVPRPLRDAAYSLFARHRYRLFGRRDTCFVPEPKDRHRFLDGLPASAPADA